ncbi:unnamed protein product [Nesidiocoris tenuis]|uniref:Uncharacterized protein n=1 Tax=Nesidiocoris tenuis TaxID=355587 RepID=A0A6H5H5R9_9HEMI|nr:unnamed protein product [Nesidiocoris tenuis]
MICDVWGPQMLRSVNYPLTPAHRPHRVIAYEEMTFLSTSGSTNLRIIEMWRLIDVNLLGIGNVSVAFSPQICPRRDVVAKAPRTVQSFIGCWCRLICAASRVLCIRAVSCPVRGLLFQDPVRAEFRLF